MVSSHFSSRQSAEDTKHEARPPSLEKYRNYFHGMFPTKLPKLQEPRTIKYRSISYANTKEKGTPSREIQNTPPKVYSRDITKATPVRIHLPRDIKFETPPKGFKERIVYCSQSRPTIIQPSEAKVSPRRESPDVRKLDESIEILKRLQRNKTQESERQKPLKNDSLLELLLRTSGVFKKKATERQTSEERKASQRVRAKFPKDFFG